MHEPQTSRANFQALETSKAKLQPRNSKIPKPQTLSRQEEKEQLANLDEASGYFTTKLTKATQLFGDGLRKLLFRVYSVSFGFS